MIAYRKAEEYRVRRVNNEAWRAGMYTMAALYSSVGSMFQEKGAKPIPYLDKPLPLSQEEVEQREREKREEFEEQLRARMMCWAAESQKKEGGVHGGH